MSVARRSGVMKSKTKKLIENATRFVCEDLEARRLLTTAIGGIFGEFDSTGHFNADGGNTFEYRQQNGTVVRIALHGDIDVEFIGMRLGKGGDQEGFIDTTKQLVDLVPAFMGQTAAQSTDLFEIYIAASAPDATISIGAVPEIGPGPRPMAPFDGSAGSIRINNARTGISQEVGSGPGAVYIGARTLDTISTTPLEQDIPILSVKRTTSFGLRPAPFNGRLGAGIFTAPGVNTGKILIGGTVTGNVDITGSIDTFYAGAVLTGDATGNSDLAAPNINDNFRVGGDIRAFYTLGGIGTTVHVTDLRDPVYSTGFDMEVGGRIGTVYSVAGDIYGSIHARNDTKGWSSPYEEVEFKDAPKPANDDESYFEDDAVLGVKTFDDRFSNDNFNNAQYIGSFNSKSLKTDNIVAVQGLIDTATNVTDDDDYYGVSLLAGQTVTVQLTEGDQIDPFFKEDGKLLHVGVFDPDGRLVATDYAPVEITTARGQQDAAQGQAFTFTADRPGTYRLAVGTTGDETFTAHGKNAVAVPYELTAKNTGNIAIGGVVADGNILTDESKFRFSSTQGFVKANTTLHAIDADNGDIGSIVAGAHSYQNTATVGGRLEAPRLDATGAIISSGAGGRFAAMSDVPVAAINGNIRAIEAADMGYEAGTQLASFVDQNLRGSPTLYAINGSVGLVRTWDVAGELKLNDSIIDPVTSLGKPSKAIGGDYQLIDAAGTFSGTLVADRAIGVIRANLVGGSDIAGSYIVNADQKGNDGTIDLIDSQTDIGNAGIGGPAIVTGPGGNVRYMHVPIGFTAYRDPFFGAGTPEVTKLRPGDVANLIDDSGTPFSVTPSPQLFTMDPSAPLTNPGMLQLLTYPIRGDVNGGSSAGSVLVAVVVDPPPGFTGSVGRGVDIKSRAVGKNGSVEIGRITVRSNGTGITLNNVVTTTPGVAGGVSLTNSTFTQIPATGGLDAPINLTGDATIDVYRAEAMVPPTNPDALARTAYTGFTTINDDTPDGEVVNVEASDLQSISAETVGLAKSHTGGGLNNVAGAPSPTTTVAMMATYPFNQQRNAVIIHGGDIISMRARRGLGNVFVEVGSIGSISANSNERNVGGVFEGINGPIVVTRASSNFASGKMRDVNIGEGIAYGGSGNFAQAGLFAEDTIENITNQGLGSDIRGPVVAGAGAGVVNPDFGEIRNIRLGDGGSIISTTIMTQGFGFEDAAPYRADGQTVEPSPRDNLNQPYLDIGTIKLTGKGGILGTRIIAPDIGNITTSGGFGFVNNRIRILGDGQLNKLSADGYGIRNSQIFAGAKVGDILSVGHGQLIDVNSFTRSVRPSAFGEVDPISGQAPSAANDLYVAFGLSPSRPKRGMISKGGLMTDTQILGSRDIDTIEAWAIQNRVLPSVVDPNDPTNRIPVDNTNAIYPMRIAFGNSLGTLLVTDGIYGANITAGTMSRVQTGNDLYQVHLATSGRMKQVTIGGSVKGNSTITANGADGQIETLNVKKNLLGTLTASVKLGDITVGKDVGSSNVHANNLDSLVVGNDILGAGRVMINNRIDNLTIGDDLNAGAIIKAKSLGTFSIGGDQAGSLQIG